MRQDQASLVADSTENRNILECRVLRHHMEWLGDQCTCGLFGVMGLTGAFVDLDYLMAAEPVVKHLSAEMPNHSNLRAHVCRRARSLLGLQLLHRDLAQAIDALEIPFRHLEAQHLLAIHCPGSKRPTNLLFQRVSLRHRDDLAFIWSKKRMLLQRPPSTTPGQCGNGLRSIYNSELHLANLSWRSSY